MDTSKQNKQTKIPSVPRITNSERLKLHAIFIEAKVRVETIKVFLFPITFTVYTTKHECFTHRTQTSVHLERLSLGFWSTGLCVALNLILGYGTYVYSRIF